MLKKQYIFLIVSIFISIVASAQTIYTTKSGTVDFTSDAPLELIEAETNSIQGLLLTEDRSFVFRVPMSTFEGFNSNTQKGHFNTNYLETAKYKYTQFEGKIIEDIDFSTPGTYRVRGKGKFSCHGITQERIIKCKLQIKPDAMDLSTQFSVLLVDHDIKIPAVVNQKIAEEILVNVQFKLLPKE